MDYEQIIALIIKCIFIIYYLRKLWISAKKENLYDTILYGFVFLAFIILVK